MREETIRRILQEKVIVIVRGVAKEDVVPFAEALYEGGVRLMEVTFTDGCDPECDPAVDCIKTLVAHFGDKMIFGAGTVLLPRQVERTKEAGGRFIISPDSSEAVIRKTREEGLVSIPGALTPSEIHTAVSCGADFVKLFPSDAFGPKYLKAVRAPLSSVKFLAVGGISEENIPAYLAAGALGFGIGSTLTDKKLIAAKDFAEITKRAKAIVSAAKA